MNQFRRCYYRLYQQDAKIKALKDQKAFTYLMADVMLAIDILNLSVQEKGRSYQWIAH